MKCAVRDSSGITLKRPLAAPSSLFLLLLLLLLSFTQRYERCPREASEISGLDCTLDDKKQSGLGEDHYPIVVLLLRPDGALVSRSRQSAGAPVSSA